MTDVPPAGTDVPSAGTLSDRVLTVDLAADGEVLPAPNPFWAHPDDGRTMTVAQRRRLLGHLRAWRSIVEQDRAMVVLEPGATVLAEQVTTVALLLDELREPLALCEPVGVAMVVDVEGAAALITQVEQGPIVPVDVLLARVARTDPELAWGVAPADGHQPIVDHLRLDGGDGNPGEVMLFLPPGASLVGSAADVLAAFAVCDSDVMVDPTGAVTIGEASALAEGREPGVDDGRLFLAADAPAVWINGRPTDLVTGHRPPVVLGPVPAHDPGSRDLARILRYDDAALEATEALEVAPDIVSVPFWTPEFCATVIRAAEAMEAWGSDDDDPVPAHELSLATISPRLFAHVEDHVAGRVAPVLRNWWPQVEFNGLQDAFVIKYTLAGQRELRLHHDLSQVSAAVRLNDGFDGGVLEFPRQGWTNAGTAIGSMVTWPSLVTHPHRSTPLVAGVKYSLTIWWKLPGNYRS